jgi:hypothetical protein
MNTMLGPVTEDESRALMAERAQGRFMCDPT